MMSKPKVSVIVPMYNVERYIGKCLDSLLSQRLQDIEIVAVDDGSPDASGSIAEEYATHDSRVKVVHRENGGLGPARNTGIEHAAGEYIGFVDSDDWADSDMFSRLYETAEVERADIVVGGYEIWRNGRLLTRNPHPLAGKVLHGKEEVEPCRRLLYGRLPNDGDSRPWPVEVWTSIYRADLVKSSGAKFKDVLSEDTFFNIEVCKSAKCISYVDGCGYCYRKDLQPSITNTFNERTAARYLGMFQELVACAESDENPGEALLRVKRKILDYSRAYTYAVMKSGFDRDGKISAIKEVVESSVFVENCKDYPTDNLSRFQSLFHRALVNGNYRFALALARVRILLKGER